MTHERECRRCGRSVDVRRWSCSRCGLPVGGLIDAARLRVIARELVSIAPDAPWFLRAIVDGNSSLPARDEPRREQ